MPLIALGICAGDIPACHAAHLHGLPLDGGDTKVFVQLVSQLYISLFVPGVPFGGVVASLTSLDTDKVPSSAQRGEA